MNNTAMPPAQNPQKSDSSRRFRFRPLTIIVGCIAALFIAIGIGSSGIGGGLIIAALFALVTGLYTLITNRSSWLGLAGRKAGAITLAASLAGVIAGGSLMPPTEEASAVTDASPVTKSSPSGSASASSTPTPTPTETVDTAPLDPEIVPVLTAAAVYTAPQSQPAYATTAADLLATLPIKGRAPKTGYDRALFGQAWADVDRNGCDTRNDMLQRDLTAIGYVNTVQCKVATGTLADPYTGTTIGFVRGADTSTAVQIDHLVALSDAWQKGAQQLSGEQRTAFANDPLNLQATDGPTNQQKGDGDAATWLPPNTGYRCEYVARQISVKATYGLWVTQAEHDAMARVLGNCAGQLAPTNQPAPTPAPAPTPVAPVQSQAPVAPAPVVVVPAPAPKPATKAPAPVVTKAPAPVVTKAPAPVATVAPKPKAPSSVYYKNCAAVRAAGAAPIHAGTPGYAKHLDGDGDGIGCDKG